jgi:hypothetical protein
MGGGKIYRCIREHTDEVRVGTMCRVLKEPSQRRKQDEVYHGTDPEEVQKGC